MSCSESDLWQKLNHAKKKQSNAKWLGEVYSLDLSDELRQEIATQLGFLGKEGWVTLKSLTKKFGIQPELIHAAGICHQKEARDWLLTLLEGQKEINIVVLKALACWGASIPNKLLAKILSQPSLEVRLSGLELLAFKAHKLSDQDLVKLTKELLADFRDPIVLATIRVLKRRNGVDICDIITSIAHNGSDATAKSAIMALGSIGTIRSYLNLSKLSQELPSGKRLDLVNKQIQHQYRFPSRHSIYKKDRRPNLLATDNGSQQ